MSSDITIYMTFTSTMTAQSTSSAPNNVYLTTRNIVQVLTMTLSDSSTVTFSGSSTSPGSSTALATATATGSGSASPTSSISGLSTSIGASQLPQSSSSSSLPNSSKLGLALGVPLGITLLFAVLALTWYVMRKRSSPKPPLPATTMDSSSSVSSTDLEKGDHTPVPLTRDYQYKHKPTPLDLNLTRKESTVISNNPGPTPTLKTFLKSRFSLYNKSQDYVISPLFLKRFKLQPTIVCKPYLQCRPDELSITVGEKVMVVKEFLDGWCKIKRDDQEGMVPKACLNRAG